MKRKQTHFLMLVFVIAASAYPTAAQKQGEERTRPGGDGSALKAQPSEARVASSNAAEGLRVTVSADSWAGDFVTYRSGENFVVVVPQAKTSAIRWNLAGQGLGGIQVEQRGEDVVVLLRVQSDLQAAVQQQGNRLDMVFAARAPSAVTGNTGAALLRQPSVAGSASAAEERQNTAKLTAQPARSLQPISPSNSAPPQGDIGSTLLGLLKKNTTADALNLDLSVPESPAFTVLELNPQTVVRPATPQEFATSLINGLDQNGNFQNGLAIDTAPYMLFNGENVKIRDYMDQYLTRLLSRTQFSFAATKGASKDDLTSRLALGMNLTFWDRGDPRIYRPGKEGDVLDCFVKNLDTTIIIPPTVDPDNEEQVRSFVASELPRLKSLADRCRADGQKANWNRSAWTVAYAPSWVSTTGKSSDFKWNGGALWTSLAYGFEEVPSLKKLAQLIFHARYRTREQVADEKNPGKFLSQNSLFFGARFRAGSPKFAFNLEDGLLRTKTLGGKTDSANRFSVGAEVRLTDNLYFVVSTGGNAGRSDGKSKGFVMTSFKYGFNKKSQLNPQPQ